MTTSTKRPETQPPPEERRGKGSQNWLIGLAALLAVGLVILVLGFLSLLPFQVEAGEPVDDPKPEPTVAALPDGEWFALITVGRDESDIITIGVDLAEMLTGQEAHDAAVEAGFITAEEDLPNDFFIKNPESVLELMKLSDDAEIRVISSSDVTSYITIDAETLEALSTGEDEGTDVYGIVGGQPIVMNLVVHGGLITSMEAVYLP